MNDDAACPPLLIPIDPALERAATWRGLSPAAYVAAVLAEAVEADIALLRFARESLDPDAAVDQKTLDAWFETRGQRPRGG